MASREKYGYVFHDDESDLEIELWMIAYHRGDTFENYMAARRILWPDRYRHRWTDLMYRNFIKNDVTVLMGCASSQKTSHAVEYALISYFARPEETLVILSSLNMDKLDIGVWAELKTLWQRARDYHQLDIPGHLVEYKRAITTDNVEDTARDFRKGCICRPCYVGGKNVGHGILAGAKQKYVIYIADELQFMEPAFSASWPHLFSNPHVKIIAAGNPKHDPEDELSKVAEPKDGWNTHPEPTKTEVWTTKFMGGRCVNLVGTDSPNFDVPADVPPPFEGLITREFAKRIAQDSGAESFDFYRLIKGVMKVAFAHSRVITRQLCREHHALEGVVWKDNKHTKLYALDPSYGGEDRCVGMPLKFGEDTEGNQILLIMPYRVFQINMRLIETVSVEDQIAGILQEELETYDVPPENCGYDACGKGTIGAALARRFGLRVPQAIDSGAQPTKRPVRADLFVDEDGKQRLKTCAEHYSKFVSEMWFSCRYAIEANQVRGMTEDVMAEGCARVYEMAAGNRIEVEPKSNPKKKEDLKRRLGKSPDLFDTFAIGVEMARRLGFSIDRLGIAVIPQEDDDFFEQEAKEWQDELKSKLLTHA